MAYTKGPLEGRCDKYLFCRNNMTIDFFWFFFRFCYGFFAYKLFFKRLRLHFTPTHTMIKLFQYVRKEDKCWQYRRSENVFVFFGFFYEKDKRMSGTKTNNGNNIPKQRGGGGGRRLRHDKRILSLWGKIRAHIIFC